MSENQSAQWTIYEFPMSTCARALLRYESAIKTLNASLARNDEISAITAIYHILELAQSIDIKSEVLQYLTQQSECLKQFASSGQTNASQLEQLIDSHQGIIQRLHTLHLPNTEYRNHYLLSSIFRRIAVAGNACSADLPLLHSWQSRPKQERTQTVKKWSAPFIDFAESVHLSLRLTRQCGDFSEHVAAKGYFQSDTKMFNDACRLLRIGVEQQNYYCPEVSANRQLLSIHFLRVDDIAAQATEVKDDVRFKLAYCTI